MNKSNSERIAAVLEKTGHKKASRAEGAGLVVINMCSVRQKPVDKTKNQISRLCHNSDGQTKPKIILTGCILEADRKRFKEMDVEIKTFKNLRKIKPRTEYVPIMKGCNNFCSYCVVPYTKGPERYRAQKEIIYEVQHLIKRGVKEITLLGQNVNSYPDFVKLLQEITAQQGDFKIKFITNHPKDFSDELINEIAKNNKIAKHIHLPVQAGNNKILKKMRRNYTRGRYLALIKKIKKQIPGIKLTTDVIVGFPEETKKQFQQTVDLLKQVKFATTYIAKYSPREGTAAYKLKDSVPWEEKKRREQILRKLVNQNASTWANQPKLTQKMVVILGPTSVGKTDLSIKLAKRFNGEVVSADSRQVYKKMDIGTGKITKKEMRGIPHELLDVASPKRRFSAAQYQKQAVRVLNTILKKKKIPFLVGGSPFYIYSVVEGWKFPKMKADRKLRKALEKKPSEELFKILKKLDPKRAKNIESQNKRRLIRAIEIAKTLGKVPALKKDPQFDCLLIGVKLGKEELKERISRRVAQMIKSGLEKEVKVLSKKYGFNSVLRESIGYQEWKDCRDKQEIIEKIKLNYQRLLKHQMTWFKRDKRIHWVKNYKEAEKLIIDFLY